MEISRKVRRSKNIEMGAQLLTIPRMCGQALALELSSLKRALHGILSKFASIYEKQICARNLAMTYGNVSAEIL